MPPREDDDLAPRSFVLRSRTLVLAGGFALAALATLAVFLTDNPQYLRVAVVAVAWAFVLAMFAAGRRDTDRVAARARETELRQAYEAELDREVAARREYELELEHELRREAENAMRYELDALRGDIAALSGLRDEVARVSELRGDLAALSGLRDEVARVAALRDDVAALMALRQDLGQLAELRTDMGRLRAELTEQLSSEMLVERIVMRTQASRMPGEPVRLDGGPGRALEGGSWADDLPPRELTGGWPAVRLDEPRETTQFEEVRIERSGLRPPVPDPAGHRRDADRVEPLPAGTRRCRPGTPRRPARGRPPRRPAPGRLRSPVAATTGAPGTRPTSRSVRRPTTMSPLAPASIARPPAPVPPPLVRPPRGSPPRSRLRPGRSRRCTVRWSSAHPCRPRCPRRRRHRSTGWPPGRCSTRRSTPSPTIRPCHRRRSATRWAPAEPHTTHRPAVPPPPVRVDDRGGYRVAVRDEEPATAPGSARDKRLADILAENGVSPSSGGRRRRRYRDDDEPDDVLARVLGQS